MVCCWCLATYVAENASSVSPTFVCLVIGYQVVINKSFVADIELSVVQT